MFLLAGCASFDGAPEPYTAKDIKNVAVCPTKDHLTDYDKLNDSQAKQHFRDDVISTCIAVVDAKFTEFLSHLRRQRLSTTLGGDLALLTLTGVSAVASKGTANALSAASTGLLGAKVAIDKDLYFEQTLPALVAAMETNRSTVLLRIRTQQKENPNYSPADARADIRAYEAAGSIDAAIRGLTATASKAQGVAADQVANMYLAPLAPADDLKRTKLVAWVHVLEVQKKTDVLGQLVTVLKAKVEPRPGDALEVSQRKAINDAITQSIAEKKFSEAFAKASAIAVTTGEDLEK